MDDPASRLRKVVGKFVLLLTGVWVMILVASVIAAGQHGSAHVPVFNWLWAVSPGCALVPGAVVSLRLLRADDADRIKDLWIKSAIYGVAGVIIGITCFVALVQTQNGGS